MNHLRQHGCLVVREGGKHTVVHNPTTNRTSSVPRHREIQRWMAEKICKDLGIPLPKRRR
ncbi:MAG: hypothetical protein YPKNTGVA_001386 [Candidatus Fervidibacter sp.]